MGIKNRWTSINHFSNLTSNDEVPGIYIWGFYEGNNFMPYYVGKAWNIASRLCTHLCCLKGGSYTIYSWQDLFKTEIDNRYYQPDTIEKRISFIKGDYLNAAFGKDEQLKDHVEKMVSNFHYTYIPMNNEEFVKEAVNVERAVLNKLRIIIINQKYGKAPDNFDFGNLEFDGRKYLKVL